MQEKKQDTNLQIKVQAGGKSLLGHKIRLLGKRKRVLYIHMYV